MQTKSLERIYLRKRLIISSLRWHRYVAARHCSTFRTSSNHYEILGLERDCTPTEIKESFIRLSKELHPDKNPDSPDVHQKFILLNEAYSVLSRPHQRYIYDADLTHREQARTYNYSGVVTDAPRDRVIFKDETLWESRDRSEDQKYEGRSYYGFAGIKQRLPNVYIAGGALLFMLVGAFIQVFIARKSSNYAAEMLDKRDRLASMNQMAAKQQAQANGNKLQMDLLRQRYQVNAQEK